MGRTSRRHRFRNGRGQELAGTFDLPEGVPLLGYGVFAPCFTCTKDSHAAAKVCRALAERGIGMLRFDITGLGESEGSFAETNFTTRRLDIMAAVSTVIATFEPPKLLIGHSIGGTAALSAAPYLDDIKLLATIGAPDEPSHIIDKLRGRGELTEKGEMVELIVAGRPILFKKSFVADMMEQDVAAETEKITARLLVFHAPYDDTVDFENARIIFDRANCEKDLVPLDAEATHLFENRTEDAELVADTIRDAFPA
ncbi:MAG: alpha/beta fold hydrolase [Alphaproteobacteria bacterium]|nr:alpha/beta fold hydrolase [Alphaproteobacteria bacterium]